MVRTGETLSKNRVLQAAGALLLLFLILFGWQFFEAHSARQERSEVERQLVFQRMATDLALAAIEASYGSFEGARELSSTFFTRLQENIDRAPPEGSTTMSSILQQRDEVITALSRRDPESPEILARIFFRYRGAIGEPERAHLIPSPPATDSPPDAAPDTTDRAAHQVPDGSTSSFSLDSSIRPD